jgi:L-ascorbate 6-phosphate lactonase
MIELWWLGQAGFCLRDPTGGPLVFCDPFLTVSGDRTWQAPITPDELASQADVVLISHEHIDHLDRPTLRAAATAPGSHFKLVLPTPIVPEGEALGFSRDRIIAAQPGDTIDLSGVMIHPVPARHGINVSDAYTFGQELSNGLTRYLGYVVELGQLRVYHAGDCIPYDSQVERLRALQPRIALLPINGRDFFRETDQNLVGNMDSREAARLASLIGADVLVPMHWELFSHNRGFPGDLVAFATANFPELSVLVMGRGARVVFTM